MSDRRARLIDDDGWTPSCGMCGGTGDNGGGVPEIGEPDPCSDCFEGLLPPEAMIEAAAEAASEAYDVDLRWAAMWEIERVEVRKRVTAALLEAERWAAKQ